MWAIVDVAEGGFASDLEFIIGQTIFGLFMTSAGSHLMYYMTWCECVKEKC